MSNNPAPGAPLARTIRTVTEDTLRELHQARPEYKWRVQECKKHGCNCVAYVDARQVMDLLDQIVGPANWQDHYREVSGNVYCDLQIRVDGEWVTKSDCGSESNIEAEKGQASDAFKRAAVKWGIGRFLYSLDIIRIKEVIDIGNNKFAPAFDGKRIWDVTKHIRQRGLDRSGQQSGGQSKSYQSKPKPAMMTEAQSAEIQNLCHELVMDGQDLLDFVKAKGMKYKELTQDQANDVIKTLQTKAANKGGMPGSPLHKQEMAKV